MVLHLNLFRIHIHREMGGRGGGRRREERQTFREKEK